MFDSYFQLGYVVAAHGLKGELKIKLDCDDPSYYKELESVFIDMDGVPVPFFIESMSISHEGKSLVKFEESNSREDAENLRGRAIYLPENMLPELNDDQFYYHQIIGYTAFDNQTPIGVIEDYYAETHTDILSVNSNGKEILIPVIDEFLIEVNHKEKFLRFNLPDGLVALYTDDAN